MTRLLRELTVVKRSGALVSTLIFIIVAVTVLNGAEFYLKRVGFVDRAAYDRYLEVHREGGPYGRGFLPGMQNLVEQPVREYLFRSEAPALKLIKDIAMIGVLLLAALCLVRRGALPPVRNAWPGYLLAGLVASSFTITAFQHGLLLPLAGLRAFAFIILALLLAGCVTLRVALGRALATAAILLLGIETAAVGLEAVRGMPIYGYVSTSPDIPGRLVGTFVMPNTLGVWTVLACTFYLCSETSRFRWPAVLMSLVLVLAGSSGTGMVVLAVLAAGAGLQRFGRRALVPIAVILALTILLLPVILGRHALFHSLPTRAIEVQAILAHLDGLRLLVGTAFGAGTTGAFHLLGGKGPWSSIVPERAADSLPAVLLMGTGVIGLLAFYGLVLHAATKDPAFRPFWIAVALTSLTLKINEVFPITLFLASALARALARDEPAEQPD